MTKRSNELLQGKTSYSKYQIYYNNKKKLGKRRYMFDRVSNKDPLG